MRKTTIEQRYGSPNQTDELKVILKNNALNLNDIGGKIISFRSAYLINKSSDDEIFTELSKQVLYIMTKDDVLYATVSPTFIDSFCAIMEWSSTYGVQVNQLAIKKQLSKRGREFLICDYVEDNNE